MDLLSNAVKYTPENGDVKFEVYEEKLAESGKVRLVSVVSDTGIGMTPEFMEQMYSALSRAVDTRQQGARQRPRPCHCEKDRRSDGRCDRG